MKIELFDIWHHEYNLSSMTYHVIHDVCTKTGLTDAMTKKRVEEISTFWEMLPVSLVRSELNQTMTIHFWSALQ